MQCGGPIGLKLTGVLARLVMRYFDKKYLAKLASLNITPLMYKRYVDDLNMAVTVFPPGVRFIAGKMLLLPEEVEQDEEEEDDRRVARELRKVANTILPRSVVMEEDFPTNHLQEKLPILDMEMWWENDTLLHQHYTKPMASRSVIMAKSAFPTSTKRNILVEEGMRRLRNCSPSLPWCTKAHFLNNLCISMMEAGHSETFRITIITRVIGKYNANLKNHNAGEKLMYRTAAEREAHFRKVGRSTKSNWFTKTDHTSTVTFPTTPGDRLVGLMKNCLEKCLPPSKTSTKVVGGGGIITKAELVRTNPFPRSFCGRSACPLKWMKKGCQEKCYREMQGYSGHCTRCRQEQLNKGTPLTEVVDQVYYGESSRSLKTRAEQHFSDYQSHQHGSKRKPVSSWMWDHAVQCHDGVISQEIRQDFTFRLQGVFRDCLSRQLDEAVRLRMAESHGSVVGDRAEGAGGGVVVINRKDEHYQPKVVQYNFFN